MPRWLKNVFLALVVVAALLKPSAIFGSPEKAKNVSAAGWHLLVPPYAPTDPPGPLELKAPLSQWMELDSTGTVAECEEQRSNMTLMSQSGSAEIIFPDIQFEMLLYHYAVCVSSSDPRLRVGRNGRTVVHNFGGFARHDRVSAGYNGPPVEKSSETAPQSSEVASGSSTILEAPRTPILLMLLGFALMAMGGPLGGWVHDKIKTSSTLGFGHSARGRRAC